MHGASERVRDGCERWLFDNRPFFSPRAGNGEALLRFKALVELMLVLTPRARGAALDPFVAGQIAFAADDVADFDFDTSRIRDPRFVLPLLIVVTFLEAAGRDASDARAVAARALAVRPARALGFVTPYRRFELLMLLERTGFAEREAGRFARAYADCRVPLERGVWAFGHEQFYGLTHLVFSLCEYGSADPRERLAEHELDRLRWMVRTCVRMALLDGNLDLLAELAICSQLLRDGDERFVRTALAFAADAQDADGSIPERGGGGTPAAPGARYHSTLMWSYASALAVQAGL
jgi:hypothetical protein